MNHQTSSRRRTLVLSFTAVLCASLMLASSVQIAAQNNFFGAIYSSNSDGSVVNQNFFATKPEVYLNGGPQNGNAAGLPDGVYYFQVTNPSGSVLLSTDPAMCRQLQIVGGVVKGAVGTCTHANGTQSANGSISVQLIPFNDTPNNGGEYKVHLIRQTSNTAISMSDPNVIIFRSADSKTDNFKVRKAPCTTCDPPVLSGCKFYDANANALKDAGEVGVAGVRLAISINGGTPVIVTTGLDGKWSYQVSAVGDAYTVVEILPTTCPTDVVGSYWVQTAPVADANGVQGYSGIASGGDVTGLDFGNVCFIPARGGLTLGFWSNKNGQAIMQANDSFASALLFLRTLCLVKPDGGDFDPATYTQFRTWLLNGNAVNMAYMLSVQLSATSLDVRYGFLKPTTIVDARGLGIGLVSIGTLTNAANTELCDPTRRLTFSGNPLRKDQEILKNALDAINNNRLSFAASAPCGVCYPL